MGMVGLRGVPDDDDSWDLAGWSWADVLPYFRRLEQDRDFSGPMHGADGPICIRRHLPIDWPPFCEAVGQASAQLGWRTLTDFNAEFNDGCGAYPSVTLSARCQPPLGTWTKPFGSRPNLSIACGTRVRRLDFSGNRCTGIYAGQGTSYEHYRANHTIVCAGAIHSPTILMRSGVGPAGRLAECGIAVVADVPGVGGNLQNHPVVYLATHLRPAARQPPSLRPTSITALRFSSGLEPASSGDLQMMVLNKSSWHGIGHAVAGLGVCLMHPQSRGTVTSSPAGPTASRTSGSGC